MAETEADRRRDELVERLYGAVLGYFDIHAVDLGLRLGLYDALNAAGTATAGELAAATATSERYVREWLEHQAAGGILAVDDPEREPDERRFSIPPGHDEALLDADSLAYVAPLARGAVAATRPLPQLLEAYRTGGGVPYADYGRDFHEAQGAGSRPSFLRELAGWLAAIPDVHERLLAEPRARVADVACGTAWSSIAIARAYPGVTVDGLDLDESSVRIARANVEAEGLAGRITVERRDAADPALEGRYDLVTVFEAIHDMARPVAALRALGGLLAAGGSLLVADERPADRFTAPADEHERYLYGWSILHCLAVGMTEQPSAGTGTVMRTSTFEAYAREAGFGGVEVLPIEHDTFRFYLLRL
jgi:SAM-dependent methyltransferase